MFCNLEASKQRIHQKRPIYSQSFSISILPLCVTERKIHNNTPSRTNLTRIFQKKRTAIHSFTTLLSLIKRKRKKKCSSWIIPFHNISVLLLKTKSIATLIQFWIASFTFYLTVKIVVKAFKNAFSFSGKLKKLWFLPLWSLTPFNKLENSSGNYLRRGNEWWNALPDFLTLLQRNRWKK